MKIIDRSTLWFNKYDHVVRFCVNEASALRKLDHDWIDKVIAMRKSWGHRIQPGNHGGSWALQRRQLIISESDITRLHQLCDFFLNDQRDRKIVLSGDVLYVYTTDVTLIQDICEFDVDYEYRVSRVNLAGQPGTIALKKSKYQFRSYFRSSRLSDNVAENLKKYLVTLEDIRVSPSLKTWIAIGRKYMQNHYFIDHNDVGPITMLGLIAPGAITRTVQIIVDK